MKKMASKAWRHVLVRGGPFGAYASLVIGRRLADYYRALHRFDAEVSLAPQTFDGTVEEDAADAGV